LLKVSEVRAVMALTKNESIALVMSDKKVDELHGLIGKTRQIIESLPDKTVVLKIDFTADVLSTADRSYSTELKVGMKRSRIDATLVVPDDEEAPEPHTFWPMWDEDKVVFEELGNIKGIRKFAKFWRKKKQHKQ
jgi:hypothetical protein